MPSEFDLLTLGDRVAGTLDINPDTYPLAYGLISRALGMDNLPVGVIPGNATFTVRRDVEYLARDPELGHEWKPATFTGVTTCRECGLLPLDDDDMEIPCLGPYGDVSPNFAAPSGDGWERSGDDDPIESEWSGSDQYVRAYRWDRYGVTVPELETLARENLWDVDNGDVEPLGGYLDEFGVHPAVSITSDGMDWNVGGVTPVYIAVDYIVVN